MMPHVQNSHRLMPPCTELTQTDATCTELTQTDATCTELTQTHRGMSVTVTIDSVN